MKKISNIGFWLEAVSWRTKGEPTILSDYYAKAYKQLFKNIIDKGANIHVIRDADKSYQGSGKFSESWIVNWYDDKLNFTYSNKEVLTDLLVCRNIIKPFRSYDTKRVNPKIIGDICRNKYDTYLFAPDYHARTLLINDEKQLNLCKMGMGDKLVALKELQGCAGKKVFVGNFSDYENDLRYPFIAQEFIDTRGGIPGLANGPHDLRVGIFCGEVIHGLLRQPPSGTLKSSTVKNGGSSRALYVDEIPQEVITIARELDKRINTNEPRFFCADFGFNGEEWKLFEMNACPSIAHRSVDGDAADEFLEKYADCLVRYALNQNINERTKK